VVLEAGGWEVIKKFVQLGLGVSIVTSICLSGEEPLAVIPLGEYFPTRSYGVVMRKGKFLSPQARSFIELMDPDFQETSEGEREPPSPLALAGRRDEAGTADLMGLDRSLP
jgi:DNA-binding transcriptional LysR family regulator